MVKLKFFSIKTTAVATALLLAGCETTAVLDNRYELSVDDYGEVALEIARDLLTHPVLTRFEAREGRLPCLDIGVIRNATRDPVVVAQFAERAMEALLNSGRVTLVAHDPAAVQANHLDHFFNESQISLSGEADFHLEGVVAKSMSRGGGRKDVTHSFMLRLNDRNRNQVWKRTIDITRQGGDPNRRGGAGLF